ncbi:DNA double-strand break repair nuclease NurA [Funiculus sociatus GB2-A5]|uniref:DNA double-strand break repair nuclease NurA n=1 Tax=Funiculus sociatus GB2-A5 TaxID=2933946 RepID=A0ABV0JHR0_9CYAN|nr:MULTISPECIES: DNA double-strand break repair nuclease NurA [unclassified Trichocoleus]MBD1904479.1 DNA double-strand break repair nuclease NurA [Trichocoleus sp. FACHB-832]MBD2064410.1 DNA double-strand break repair nuclease NurA [Trichocoleus sp. FACHB-6]
MLDLTKLARQMQGISQHLTLEAAASRQRLERAQQFFIVAKTQQAELVQRQEKWRDRITFNAATPVEPLSTCIDLPIPPACHTVIATDGSQIAPNHHEIAYCYLINVGRVMLHYGQSLHPLLDSLPEVFYQPEDLYVSRQWGIRTEEWMGYRRTASEASVLAELACNWVNQREVDKGKKMLSALSPVPNPQSPVPTLAMVDGSLIYWFLEQLPGEARDRILPPILEAWDALREAGIPIMGYLSASRSSDSLNFLRLPACPHPVPDCMTHCPGQTDRAPCQVFDPLRDTFLWASQLQPGQRSTLWRSSARILDLYGEHQIYFCYVHVGTEIARVEVPAWVAENPEKLDSALSLMLAQVQKGYGYPVALAEAHNQAVVRGGDRARFFALLEQQMIKAGLRNVGTSYKEARKRGSIA